MDPADAPSSHADPSPARPHLLLIGLRGSGKSTVGPLLAHSLRIPFTDLDQETLARLGCDSVAQAWREHSEPIFRHEETEALSAALDSPPRVIASGGGAPASPASQKLIKTHQTQANALVIYLRADPATLRARLKMQTAQSDTRADADRPSLTRADPLDEIETVYAARDPLYTSLADLVLASTGQPADTAAAILRALETRT